MDIICEFNLLLTNIAHTVDVYSGKQFFLYHFNSCPNNSFEILLTSKYVASILYLILSGFLQGFPNFLLHGLHNLQLPLSKAYPPWLSSIFLESYSISDLRVEFAAFIARYLFFISIYLSIDVLNTNIYAYL